MRLNLTCAFLIIVLLSGCSWVEYFAISNNSQKEIVISYVIDNDFSGINIFNAQPRVYALKKANIINWDKKLTVVDNDTSKQKVTIHLPPNSVVIIGELFNDSYEKYNQEFINGIDFNLKQIKIKEETEIVIVPSTFDSFFTKKKGIINYPIKALN